MFNQEAGKPVDVIATESFRLEGEHIERHTIIKGMAADLAMELAGAGKVRAATEAAIKEAKAAQANAKTIAAAQAASAPASNADAIAAAVTAALLAAGIVPQAPKAAT